jgi:putative peptide zinc metalloprotease protein
MSSAAVWSDELDSALAAPTHAAGEEGESLWSDLAAKVDFNEQRPRQDPHVVVREIEDKVEHYFVLKNADRKTYLRLSPDEYTLWQLMDGTRTVTELIVEHFVSSGAFARNMVTQLVGNLLAHEMLLEKPVNVWMSLKGRLRRRSWLDRATLPARALLSQQLKIPGIDRVITVLYRGVGWLFFTRPAQVLLAALSVAGFVVFNWIVQSPNYHLLTQVQPSELVAFWLAAILPVVVHELGHALTVKHYGREINAGGLMLYFGLPAAYVDTSDIWLGGRRARMSVTWNGPYTGLMIGGLCAILMWVYPQSPGNPFLFKMATIAYLTVFINLNPLLKYDGYYILSDWLRISFLRERSLAFLRRGLLGKITSRSRLTRDEWIFVVFGVLSLVWTAYALSLAVTFWQARLSSSVQVLLGNNYSILTKALFLLSAGAIISLLLLFALGLVRLTVSLVNRFIRGGGLQRHVQLALIMLAVSAVAALGVSYAVEIYRGPIVILVVSGVSIATLAGFIPFGRSYYFSNRWLAQSVLVLALIALALVPLAEWFMPTGSAHSRYLILAATGLACLAGFLFILPAIRGVKPLQYLIGLLVAAALAAGGYVLGILSWTVILVPLLGFVAALDWFNLRGSGRRPAIALVFLGVAVAAVAFAAFRYIPRYWSLGVVLACAGFWHFVLARLPRLSKIEAGLSPDKRAAIGTSVHILVRRVISQVYFESGLGGIGWFGRSFTSYTKSLGIDLSITGNKFRDGELSQRATVDLTEIYGLAFDRIFDLMRARFGEQFARTIISLGIDLIPWQYRELIGELVLDRRDWGKAVNRQKLSERDERIKLLDRVPIFVNATYEDLQPIVEVLTPQQFAAREVIIRQGDPGDTFYIIQHGKVSVFQKHGDEEPRLVNTLGPGQAFGEAALITDNPRNATIIAATPTVVLALGRSDFEALVKEHLEFAQTLEVNLRNGWVLRNMPIFDELSAYDLVFLTNKLKPEAFKAGETVIQEGAPGDKFYVIESGELAAYRASDGQSVELERLFAGDYFGETALIYDRPRNASVVTLTDASLFSLHREDFTSMLGNFENMRQLLERTSTRRMKNVDQ